MNKEKLLIVGFGDIGCRMLSLIDTRRYDLFGLCRSAKNFPLGVSLLRANVCEAEKMRPILEQKFDVIVVTLSPDERSDSGYKRAYVDSMQTLVAQLHVKRHKPRLVVFISSTSVYGQNRGGQNRGGQNRGGQNRGQWVDECSATGTANFAGTRLLDAEQVLLNSDLTGCIVRFSGIYGGGQPHLIQQVKQGLGCVRLPEQYTNRIHRHDCAGVLVHLIEHQRQGHTLAPIYLATDCEPATLWEVKQWLAKQLGLPQGHLREIDTAGSATSKRCSNRRLLETGYHFKYPSFRQGYKSYLQGEK